MTVFGAGLSAIAWVGTEAIAAALGSAITAGMVAAVIIVLIAVIGISLAINSANRENGDVMIGIGEQALPYPQLKAWMDHGNDGHGSSWKGWVPMSIPGSPSPLILYAAISPLSSSWKRIFY